MSDGEYVVEDGVRYRMPYQTVKELTFRNLKKEELVDLEHTARLQYRLLLLEAVIRANVEFVTLSMTVTYNPEEASNNKAKMSRQQIVEFLKKQGVNVSQKDTEEKELDYYRDIYSYQYNPPSVREHQPYGYTPAEWKRMKNDYTRKKAQYEKNNKEKFREWQRKYLLDHPELEAVLGDSKT